MRLRASYATWYFCPLSRLVVGSLAATTIKAVGTQGQAVILLKSEQRWRPIPVDCKTPCNHSASTPQKYGTGSRSDRLQVSLKSTFHVQLNTDWCAKYCLALGLSSTSYAHSTTPLHLHASQAPPHARHHSS